MSPGGFDVLNPESVNQDDGIAFPGWEVEWILLSLKREKCAEIGLGKPPK